MTRALWEPVPCEVCGEDLLPAGRGYLAVTLDRFTACCRERIHSPANTRRAMDEHDTELAYWDPAGWGKHIAECSECVEYATRWDAERGCWVGYEWEGE